MKYKFQNYIAFAIPKGRRVSDKMLAKVHGTLFYGDLSRLFVLGHKLTTMKYLFPTLLFLASCAPKPAAPVYCDHSGPTACTGIDCRCLLCGWQWQVDTLVTKANNR